MGEIDNRTAEPVARGGATSLSPLSSALIIALAYYVGARVGFALTLAPIPVSTLWPPNAMLLAGLLLTPRRRWPLILGVVFIAHLAVQFQSGVPAAMVLSWFVSNCAEALLGATLLRLVGRTPVSFDTLRATALFFICAGFTAPFLSSFLDAAFVVANQWGDADYWTIWRTRFFSNMLATLTLVPVIVLSVTRLPRLRAATTRQLLEAIIGLALLLTLCWVVFVHQEPGPGTAPALLYSPLLILVAAAVRFGPWGAATAILTCALVAIWGAILGQGPFITSSAPANALSIQTFLIVTWIPIMALAAVLRERALANATAQRNEQQLADAVEAAQLGRWEYDIAGDRLTWSDETRRIYEVPLDVPVTPATFDGLVHPDDRGILAAATADGLGGKGIDAEFRICFPDGRIKWILSKGTTICDDAGQPIRIVGIKVDVTKRKAAELRLHRKRRELAHSSRVSMADELSAALAHEVNQPLAAILANASAARRFLTRNPPDLQELAAIVESIADDNRRAAAVIARFGALMKRGDAPWTPVAIDDVVRGVVDIARADVISRGVSMSLHLAPETPRVLGDSLQLQQVLLHLIINACDAMEGVAPESRRLRLDTSGDGGWVRVRVSDTGAGLPADLERMFEPFVTTKQQRLGLGLTICRSIIAAHSGRLTADACAGGGAVFSFTLPAIAAERSEDETTAETIGRRHP
jgi:two-component system, LuxR family, sensor kinase FixL